MNEPMSAGWPRLTEDLPYTGWQQCQSCGVEEAHAFQEHDDRDRVEPRGVRMCDPCAEEIIEPHPRLYKKLHPWAPLPGHMALCVGCHHRDGYACGHPDLTINGGPGLAISFPRPTRAHFYRGRGRSGWETIWNGPPTSCAGQRAGPYDRREEDGG